jgi:glutathione S-transferase
MMRLRTSPASPFGRKVKIVAAELGLFEQLELVETNTLDPADPIRKDNPLGKIPTLVTEEGVAIFDSRVIVEYLDLRAGGNRLVPAETGARIAALTLMALADGICDAALLVVYEGRFRPADKHEKGWLDHQQEKVTRGLAYLESTLPAFAGPMTVGHVAVACALGYQDLRFAGTWRADHPRLVAWLTAFEAHVPSFATTRVQPT